VNLWQWFKALFGASPAGPRQTSLNFSSPSKVSSTSEQRTTSKAAASKPKSPSARKFSEKLLNTPNVSNGRTIKPQAIVLHHTAGSVAGSVAWSMNPASRVSYHCIVGRNGWRWTLADPDERTWHAGKSEWRGRRDLNSWSIGAAFEGNTYKRTLGMDEMASMAEYLVPLMRRYGLTLDDVTDHRTVAPGRKDDLNPVELARFKAYLAKRI
jgi:AmpD protein